MQVAALVPSHLALVIKEPPLIEAEFVEPLELTDPLMRYTRPQAAQMFTPPVSVWSVRNYHKMACSHLPQYSEDFATFDKQARPATNKRTALLYKHIKVLIKIQSLFAKRWHKSQVVEYLGTEEFLNEVSEILGKQNGNPITNRPAE